MNLIPNSFGLTVYAENVIHAESSEDFISLYKESSRQNRPFLVLGGGSNTLFTTDFKGAVAINKISGINVTQDDDFFYLDVGAGELWHKLVEFTIEHNMPGLENLALIPGTAGSAPIQNIGAYGIEFKDVAHYVELINLTDGSIIKVKDGQYGYRDSIFKHQYKNEYIVYRVGLKLAKHWQPILDYGELKTLKEKPDLNVKQVFDLVCSIRKDKLPDPSLIGNGGSFFKNPIVTQAEIESILSLSPSAPHYPQADGSFKVAAGWLIDQCGLKGYHIGGAAVHDKQALVLINKGDATPSDIIALARHVKQTVLSRFNILLSPEIRFIGALGEIDADHAIA